jgi:hypothetical protein
MSAPARSRDSKSSAPPPHDHASAPLIPSGPIEHLQHVLGNRTIQKLAHGGFRVASHDHPLEREGRAVAGGRPSPETTIETHPLGGGAPIDPALRVVLERQAGRELGGVRVHHDPAAADALRARAFTAGSDIVLGGARPDLRLLVHEATHAGRARVPLILRQTAQELIDDYNADSDGEVTLGVRLASLTREGRFALVREVLGLVGYFDRDDVIFNMFEVLTVAQVIAIGRSTFGQSLLEYLRGELRSGWMAESEATKSLLISAVLGNRSARNTWNRERIETFAGSDLARLAAMFEDPVIVDDGTVQGRLESILSVTQHLVIPGLQTGIEFSDTGFRGTRDPSGPGFRDPHPTSQNQPGHFLTAVGMRFQPELVSRPIPLWGSTVRDLVGAPETMSDEDVALRLTIGHEKAPDPPGGLDVALSILFAGAVEEYLAPAPEDETEEERDRRVGDAMVNETERRIRQIIAAFTAQFRATTDDDIAAWNETLGRIGTDAVANTAAIEGPGSPLDRIAVDPALRGNSRQDLRLSLMGWRFGQMIRNGDFANNAAVAAWIRANLGE